ncbi:uncharacterized protein RSE6_04988 [Rhynchosporium secalis]|uniref:Uncharacterized protein n=1 Tax=Rhynchosporium secalis TaxID=38038 RepID=A0A1E1M6Q0_RHYSE|nr:uncharacterized protein RSE6_04988 [Rhynchosporium secalis]
MSSVKLSRNYPQTPHYPYVRILTSDYKYLKMHLYARRSLGLHSLRLEATNRGSPSPRCIQDGIVYRHVE